MLAPWIFEPDLSPLSPSLCVALQVDVCDLDVQPTDCNFETSNGRHPLNFQYTKLCREGECARGGEGEGGGGEFHLGVRGWGDEGVRDLSLSVSITST